MTAPAPRDDAALDALLADHVPPPMPADLAARVTATATALPQDPAPVGRAPRPVRDRRGAWLRRPLIVGAAALGLAFSGALAAGYAGVELPTRMRAVLARLPFVAPKAAPPARSPERRHQAPVRAIDAPPPLGDAVRHQRMLRRLERVRAAAAERRAAGLPTPRADRIEQRIERRIARRDAAHAARPADPDIRAERRALRQARRAARADILDGHEMRRRRLERWRAMHRERLLRWRQRRAAPSSDEGSAAPPR
jgi:hypothetical protein